MNSIPKGYKKTEIGVIPEDWEFCYILDKKNLNEASIQTGPFGTLLKASEYTSNGIPVISVREIRDGYIFIFEETPFVGGHTCKRLPQFILEEGDIVFARKGGVDRSAIVQKKYGTLFLGSDGIRLRFKKENPEYIAFWFHSDLLKKELLQNATGTIMANMSQEIMSHLPLLLPPLPEQKAIAQVLSDMDALVETQKALIAKKRDIKQGAMQDLLSGRVRLPDYETKGWKHTDIGKIPDDWKVWELGEICQCDMNTLSSSTDPNYSFTYISLECVDSGMLTNTFEYIFSKAPSRARKIVNQYNILISTVRPNLKSHYYQSSPCENLICSTGFTVLQTNNNVGKFIFYHFFSNIINKQIETIVSGSNYPSINTRDVASLKIPLPPYTEQKAIAQVLSDMDNEIETLEAELEKLNHMKRGMMQELLTGRIRLV